MNAKRFLVFVCICSTALLLLSPVNAAAQRGGGGGGGRGGGGGQPASGHGGGPGGPGPSANHGGYPAGGYHPAPGYRGGYYYGGYYRPYYRPYFYSPYFYNGFYTSFYYGLGWPYWSVGFGYPYYGYYGYYGYPCCGGYPYPAYYSYSSLWSSARLEMKPREAQVYVDGYYVGTVNDFDGIFQRLDVPVGQHELEVYLPGYQTWKQQVMFQPGEGYHYKGELQPLPPGAPQDPKPQPNPNAQPNNAPQGYGGQPGYPPPTGGEPNTGMYPYPPPNGGEPGRTQPMPPERHPNTAPSAGFGTLNLRVQPGDAVVQIDGDRWDNPDGGSRLIVQLAAGPHRIEVRKDGYRPYSTTIQVHSGEPQTINVVLPPQ